MNDGKAEEIQTAISAQFPDSEVTVTPCPDGADIVVTTDGDQVRRFKIDDDDLNSPIVASWSVRRSRNQRLPARVGRPCPSRLGQPRGSAP